MVRNGVRAADTPSLRRQNLTSGGLTACRTIAAEDSFSCSPPSRLVGSAFDSRVEELPEPVSRMGRRIRRRKGETESAVPDPSPGWGGRSATGPGEDGTPRYRRIQLPCAGSSGVVVDVMKNRLLGSREGSCIPRHQQWHFAPLRTIGPWRRSPE